MVSPTLQAKFLELGVDLERAHPVATAMFLLADHLSDIETIAALRICEQAIMFSSDDEPALRDRVVGHLESLLTLVDKETRALVDGEPS